MEGAAELVKTLERFPQVASVEAASDGIRVFSQGTDGLLPQDCAGGPFLGVPEPPPALQMAVLINPIVYMSEGLRAALTRHSPHAGAAYYFRPPGFPGRFGRDRYPRFPQTRNFMKFRAAAGISFYGWPFRSRNV